MSQPPAESTPPTHNASAQAALTALPILEQRRLEANILKHVYHVLLERLGRDQAREMIDQIVRQAAVAQGEAFAKALGRTPTLQDFAEILPNWTREDALRIDTLHASAERLDFNVTRCRYAEMYRDMELGDLGPLLSCNRDGSFCTGYNPAITLTRTQTLMQGATHCDFRYRLKDSDSSADSAS